MDSRAAAGTTYIIFGFAIGFVLTFFTFFVTKNFVPIIVLVMFMLVLSTTKDRLAIGAISFGAIFGMLTVFLATFFLAI
jgi:hypothetical protein